MVGQTVSGRSWIYCVMIRKLAVNLLLDTLYNLLSFEWQQTEMSEISELTEGYSSDYSPKSFIN
jgi:hypothetical protein